jgi:hypothetical protein
VKCLHSLNKATLFIGFKAEGLHLLRRDGFTAVYDCNAVFSSSGHGGCYLLVHLYMVDFALFLSLSPVSFRLLHIYIILYIIVMHYCKTLLHTN